MLPSFTTSSESVQISEAPKETKGGYVAAAAGSGATGSGAFVDAAGLVSQSNQLCLSGDVLNFS